MGPRSVRVTVVYCAPGETDLTEIELAEGATVNAALAASGILTRHPELRAAALDVGIWGRRCRGDELVGEGDRVELYRPLSIDPKEARRVRAEVKRKRANAR